MKKFIPVMIVSILILSGLGTTAFTTNISKKPTMILNGSTSVLLNENNKIITTTDEMDYWAVIISINTSAQPYIYNSIVGKSNWNESHIIRLCREKATRENILNALDWLAVNSDFHDVVLFSHNGHGVHRNGRYGIAPWDHNTIFTDELDEKLDAIECMHMCLIFDCCFSGSFVGSTLTLFEKDNIFQFRETFMNALDDENRIILMSTIKKGTGVFANNYDEDGNIVSTISFARFVAEAFLNGVDDNNDGWVSAEEAFRYGKKKYMPYAIFFFLFLPVQILSFILSRGSFAIPFPTLYDAVEGELPIVKI
jgi:hypothetical protein